MDSEHIVSEFKKNGYSFQEEALGVDTLIINTCAFIEDAKRESVDTILKAIDSKKEGKIKRIIVAGCLSQRYKDELLKELKEIDEFRGVLDLGKLSNNGSFFKLTPKHYSYIKISEGCSNRCTYCIIPYLKGDYKSRPIESIKKEASFLIENGVKEVVLVGQDSSLYGIDLYGAKKLAELLSVISGVLKNIWLRVLYLHPTNLNKEVVKVIRDNKNICRYVDLPIEHISDKILKRMNRKINKKDILSLIGYIRKELPDAAIRTSIIVGFPGETDADFKELLSFIKDARFERLGAFLYSREEGTPAYNYKEQIPDKEKDVRFDKVMSLQQDISKEVNEGFKGRTLKVLIEEKEDDCYLGRTEYDAPEVDGLVYVKGKALKIGDFANVRITDTYEYDLVGETA